MPDIKKIQKRVTNMRDNAVKAYSYIIAKQREEIKNHINLRKQLEAQLGDKAITLEGLNRNVHPEEYAELAAEVRNFHIKLQMEEEIISQYQLNLMELGVAEDSDFE